MHLFARWAADFLSFFRDLEMPFAQVTFVQRVARSRAVHASFECQQPFRAGHVRVVLDAVFVSVGCPVAEDASPLLFLAIGSDFGLAEFDAFHWSQVGGSGPLAERLLLVFSIGGVHVLVLWAAATPFCGLNVLVF